MTKHKNLMFISSILFSVFITIYSFFGSGFKINNKTDDTIFFTNHDRRFILCSNETGSEIFENDKKIAFLPKAKIMLKNKPTNCALAAAIAGGAALAALGGGFMSGLGLATTELEMLFAMAAEGATIAELWSAYIGMVGFWAAVGVGIGAIA